jgi:hypothetical protein
MGCSNSEEIHSVDRSTDLKGVWQEIGESLPSTGTVTAFTDSEIPDSAGRVFYRVRRQDGDQ